LRVIPFSHGDFFGMGAGFTASASAVCDAAQEFRIEMRPQIQTVVMIGVLHGGPILTMRPAPPLWLD